MLIKDIMTKKVITAPSNTSIGEAQKIMREGRFRHLPVVDDGELVGLVTDHVLERASFTSTAPLLWQVANLVARTTLKDIMIKDVITISPQATAEQGYALALKARIGSVVVVEEGSVVGIFTRSDLVSKLVNPILGMGEAGCRIIVLRGGDGKSAEKILSCVNQLGIGVKIIWTLPSTEDGGRDIIIHLDTDDPGPVIRELGKLGYQANSRAC